MSARVSLTSACALLVALASAVAHDSPDDVIHALTHRIAAHGPSARLLTARAFEHQAVRQWEPALADFAAALELQPNYRPALIGRAQVFLRQGAWSKAEEVARHGLTQAAGPAAQAPFHALLARLHRAQDDADAALADWRRALRSPQPEIDWFLGEAECLAHLGRFDDQVAALADAMNRNPSVVLRRAWIRALIAAGQTSVAMPEIARGLNEARWKSTWLLLRARAQLRQGQSAEADAAAALTEIRGRLNAARPDPWLEAEAAEAQALLAGRTTTATSPYHDSGAHSDEESSHSSSHHH